MVPTSGFPVTRWTLVIRAGHENRKAADQALEELCRDYWYPVYAFIRRTGNAPEEAQDLTQDFFARFLEKRHVTYADPSKGRFRTFLLTSVKHFLIDQADKRSAAKRGGRERIIGLDCVEGEQRYALRGADNQTPETIFEREWAGTLITRVMEDVRNALEREGRTQFFDRLKQYLPGTDDALPYPDLARELDTTEGAVKVAVHRLRRRYREMFRAQIAHLVSDAGQVDDEIRHLLHALRG
jgi:RNA polymerase sigma-70 factor (ECF subfamily)